MPSKPGDTSPHTGTTPPEPVSSSTGTVFPEDRDVTTIAGETRPSEEPQPVAIDSQEHTSYQYNQDIDDASQKITFPGDPCPNLRDYGAQAQGKHNVSSYSFWLYPPGTVHNVSCLPR